MSKKCISAYALYCYTQRPRFEEQIHLVFAVKNFPEHLENEINAISVAANIQLKYLLKEKIQLLSKDFQIQQKYNEKSVAECEQEIHDCVENIMALDLALLKFASSVPDMVKNNCFSIPANADEQYLVREYMSIKEQQMIAKISKSYRAVIADTFNEVFKEAPKINDIIFNNSRYTSRVSPKDLDKIREPEYMLLLDLISSFFEHKENRDVSTYLPKHLTTQGVDVRTVTYTMVAAFSNDKDILTHLNKFISLKPMPVDAVKRVKTMQMTLRQCSAYAKTFMVLIVYLILGEENETELHPMFEDYRRQVIITLSSLIYQLLEYIQYKTIKKKQNILYSKLPLINIENISSGRYPILRLIYVMQYCLNFAAFLFNTI